MPAYRKRIEEIDAIQYSGWNAAELVGWADCAHRSDPWPRIRLWTAVGDDYQFDMKPIRVLAHVDAGGCSWYTADPHDYVVRLGLNGTLSVINRETFERQYELVPDRPKPV